MCGVVDVGGRVCGGWVPTVAIIMLSHPSLAGVGTWAELGKNAINK